MEVVKNGYFTVWLTITMGAGGDGGEGSAPSAFISKCENSDPFFHLIFSFNFDSFILKIHFISL